MSQHAPPPPLVPGDRIEIRQPGWVRGIHAPDVVLGQRTTATVLPLRSDDWLVAVLDAPTKSGVCLVQIDTAQTTLVCQP